MSQQMINKIRQGVNRYSEFDGMKDTRNDRQVRHDTRVTIKLAIFTKKKGKLLVLNTGIGLG